MSQLKAKQLKLPEAGSLLIGGTGGTGTAISAVGKTDKILRVVNGAPAWSLNDHLVSNNGFNTVTTTDAKGVSVTVQNAGGTAGVNLATFASGSAGDEAFAFSSTAGTLTIGATGTAADVDIVIAPQGNGDVIIGNAGGGIIQADDGEDLALFGGKGLGNLFLSGGDAGGKIYYAENADDATREVATIGGVATAVADAKVTQTRSQFDGSQTFTLASKTIPASIIAHVNGLAIKDTFYAYNGSTNIVTFNTAALGYTMDNADQVVFTYEVTA